jgi:UDP-N-acetylglucosamine--N-acetylmuramyl-(pentapeptide) pyrophosphoryl-undecaprenol N-acetylglucosamine transferase
LTHNVAGYWASRWFLKEQRATLVVGLGGPASAATVRAAISRGIPTVMLEQDVIPGRVTRWLARSATAVCVGFRETAAYFPSAVAVTVTGNPARPAFERLYRRRQLSQPQRDKCVTKVEHPTNLRVIDPKDRPSLDPGSPELAEVSRASNVDPTREKRLIVIGGAGGARSLNESMPAALSHLGDRLATWQIVHQSGDGQLQDTTLRYRESGVDALVVAYIDEIAPIMFESDLVVCRSAGTTLAELALAGAPAILVPLPPAIDYQMANAEVYASNGAAIVIDETDLTHSLETELRARLQPLVCDPALRSKMAAKMRTFAIPAAAANVTDVICRILCSASLRLAA